MNTRLPKETGLRAWWSSQRSRFGAQLLALVGANDAKVLARALPLWRRVLFAHTVHTVFVHACSKGKLECVEVLLNVCAVKANHNEAFRMACRYNHLEVVKCLLPLAQVNDCESVCAAGALYRNDALVKAAKYKSVDCVRWLLPQADPLFRNSLALQQAILNHDQRCFEVLLPSSRAGARQSPSVCRCSPCIAPPRT